MRVAVDLPHALLGNGGGHLVDVALRVGERCRLQRRHARLVTVERVEVLVGERVGDRAHPVRPLGMPRRYGMAQREG